VAEHHLRDLIASLADPWLPLRTETFERA
jgi:hypothetical protein